MAKEKAVYVPVQTKIAEHQAKVTELTAQMENAPEDQKAGLQEQINEQLRKIRWYEGRLKSPKFQAKEAEAMAAPAPAPVVEQPTEVAPVAEQTTDPREG